MRYVRALPFLLLMGGAADADSAETRVRALIDSYRSEDSRRKREVVFDGTSGRVSRPLVCEYHWEECDRFRFGHVRFTPRAGAVDVVALTLVTLPEDGPSWTPDGCTVRKATMSSQAYAEFVERAQLVVRAKLARRTGPVAALAEQRPGRWHVGDLRVRVGALFEGKGDLTPAVWVEDGLIETAIEEHGRAYLLERLLTSSLKSLTFESTEPPAGLVPSLRKELASTNGWRRDLRAAFLGWLGGVADLEALRATGPLAPVAARARLQIELVASASSSPEGLDRLLSLTSDPDAGLSAWARVVARTKFKEAYRKKLARDPR